MTQAKKRRLRLLLVMGVAVVIWTIGAGFNQGISADSEETYKGLKLFSVLILFVIIAWFTKNLSISFIGNLFKNYIILTDYIQTNFIFNMVIGILLLPIVILAVFLPSIEMVYTGVMVWLAVYLYRIIRQIFTGLSYRKFSLFYRILYLCTFEIIPLLVLTKLVMSLLT